ncbi:hypothetical protein [Calothrix sp. PCC 7507]|uniref:hypothetical protein n=1 Tax=Calothrix sp. PCC 7507 TaxID=99598 RepID=UPI00029F4D0E|nr:hypothetical protein [Calothrix sp. PCC 7507]AFY36324.1 hypothetical protein Cal7507_6017 [Calothrix sp. PCC 7507]
MSLEIGTHGIFPHNNKLDSTARVKITKMWGVALHARYAIANRSSMQLITSLQRLHLKSLPEESKLCCNGDSWALEQPINTYERYARTIKS